MAKEALIRARIEPRLKDEARQEMEAVQIQEKIEYAEPLQMSYEEFLKWADEDTRAEWVDGKVIVLMPPKEWHQTLVAFLDRVLGFFVEIFGLGRVYVAPFEVKLGPTGPAREPDLLFVATGHLNRVTADRIVGPPDLIVEIVSTDSVQRDRVDKFDEYEAFGVAEYWIIDNRPNRRRAQFFQLDANGQYQAIPPDAQGIYRSQVLPNFWLRVEWLWQEQPDPLRALVEIVGMEGMVQAVKRASG